MEARIAKGNVDEVALVKVASAWAWYHHHPLRAEKTAVPAEYDDHLPSRKAPNPSRYKLEAAMTSSVSSESSQETADAEISLLDSYEIQRISRQLDVYIKSSRDEYYKSLFVASASAAQPRDSRKVAALESETTSTTTTAHQKNFKHRKKQHSNGLWSSSVPCCSTSHDAAVEPPPPRSKMESPSRQRRPGDQVMVVKAASCRPRRG